MVQWSNSSYQLTLTQNTKYTAHTTKYYAINMHLIIEINHETNKHTHTHTPVPHSIIIFIIIFLFLAHQHKACRQLKIKQEMTAVGD